MTDFPAIEAIIKAALTSLPVPHEQVKAAWAEYERIERLREMNDRLAGALNDALTNEFEWFVEAETAVAANAALEDG